MRFEITRKSGGSLPLVSEIPDYGVAQLEGFNGVGKTLTVQVLQLCAGTYPRLPKEVWRSFCLGLGEIVVVATQLTASGDIVWTIDGVALLAASEPDDADNQPNQPDWRATQPTDEWFISITRDGQPTTIDEVRSLFAVERIAGDRGLIEMLAEEADSAAISLTSVIDNVTSSHALSMVETVFSDLAGQFSAVSSSMIREHRDEAKRARTERDTANGVLADAVQRQDMLDGIAMVRARLDAISEEAEQLAARIASINADAEEVRANRDTAAQELQQAESVAGQSDEVRKEIARTDAQYRRATKDRERIAGELALLAGMAGVEPEVGPDSLKQRLAEIGTQLLALERRRNEIDAGPAVVKLVDAVRPAFTVGITSGLGDVELLRRADDPLSAWTVNEVSEALAIRRDEMGAVTSPREATALDEEIRRLRTADSAARGVPDKQHRLQLAIARQDTAQSQAADLTAKLDAGVAANLDQLRAKRRELDDRLYSLTAERTVLEYRRDAIGSPEQREILGTRLAELVDAAAISLGDLDALLADAARQTDIERQALAGVQERERAASAQYERDVANVRALVVRLSESDAFAWLRQETLRAALPTLDQELDEQLDLLDRLGSAVNAADQRVAVFRQSFQGLRQNLLELARELRTGQTREGRQEAHWEALRGSLKGIAEEWFDSQEVRTVLLQPDATDVTVDVVARQVAWRDAEGERRTKPLEGLSSGEQAFAFTQAQLALLQHTERAVPNRLIVLDEFGAFVSSNRLRPLRGHLQDWHDRHPNEQILLILPASRDYESLAETAATHEQRARFRRNADALKPDGPGWFVEEFEP